MAAKYIFRLDDISWDMNFDNFNRIKDLFFKYNIKPIIGVIPDNKDTKLKNQSKNTIDEQLFWALIRKLQDEHGWSVSLHGYDHVYISNDSGLFKINNRAEFAGRPYDEQFIKIEKGKAILEEQGLIIQSFMAPAHSLDWNTVKALKSNGINCVTDGRTAFPYTKREVLFVPQMWPWPRKRLIGIQTVCLHINTWDSNMFDRLGLFLKNKREHIISFDDILGNNEKYNRFSYRLINNVSRIIYTIDGKLITVASSLIHLIRGTNHAVL